MWNSCWMKPVAKKNTDKIFSDIINIVQDVAVTILPLFLYQVLFTAIKLILTNPQRYGLPSNACLKVTSGNVVFTY